MRASLFICGLFLIISGCQPSPAELAVDQYYEGDKLYGTYCASCHDVENGIGPRLTKEVVATRVNGQVLFNYNKRNMPYQAGNTLNESEYWAITAYMLIKDEFWKPTEVLSEKNAAGLMLNKSNIP